MYTNIDRHTLILGMYTTVYIVHYYMNVYD